MVGSTIKSVEAIRVVIEGTIQQALVIEVVATVAERELKVVAGNYCFLSFEVPILE